MDVTPDMARHWLHNNFANRRCDEGTVKAYARDILNGTWVATHQGIAFNDRDELIDGQHRLRAIILAGRTVRMMVTFGLPSRIDGHEMTTMDAVDRGRPRSVADQLKIQHGLKDGSVIAMTARCIAALCADERTRRMSVGQTLEIYRAFQSEIDYAIMLRPRTVGLRQAGVLAGFAFAGATEEGFAGGGTPIAGMYQHLVTGDGLKASSPIGLLRTFLVSDAAKLLNRGTDRGLSELVLQAIHLEQQGHTVKKLELAPDGAARLRAAQPDRVARITALFALPA